MSHLTEVIEEQKKILKAWNKDVFSDQEFADILEEGMYKSALAVYDDLYRSLLSIEATMAQRDIDVPDEYSEEGYYNRGYFEAIDDVAKRINTLKSKLLNNK